MTAGYHVRPLAEATWPAFAELVERHNGVWGGCWCMAFHSEGVGRAKTSAQNRSAKECRVREGCAHAALVYVGQDCVGWCQFGPADQLPRIKHRRAYLEGLSVPPDWRITCFFVDREHRRSGVASAALEGVLQEIARLGAAWLRASPRTSTAGWSPPRFSTTARLRCSRATGSSDPDASASIAGWSAAS